MSDAQVFQEAREVTHGFSALFTARDVAASGRALERVAEELEAVIRAPDLTKKLQEENSEVLRQIMDGLSLDLAALRMSIRRGGRLFGIVYFFSIRRFHRTARRIAHATDLVRAHLPKAHRATQQELSEDAAHLSDLIEQNGEWVEFGDVLQEDRERWQPIE